MCIFLSNGILDSEESNCPADKSESTLLVPDYLELAKARKQACSLAGKLSNGWYPHFKFERGLAWYAIAYMIEVLQGKKINEYQIAQIRYYGKKVFPEFYQQVLATINKE